MSSFWQRLPRFRRTFVPAKLGMELLEPRTVPAFVAGPDEPVNATVLGTQTTNSESVAVSPVDGKYLVVWEGNGPGDTDGIFARLFNPNGTPFTGEFLVNTTTAGLQERPAVAADGNGNFVVAWDGPGSDGNEIYFQRIDLAGALAGSEIVANDVTTGIQIRASVGADSAGNFVIAWETDDTDGRGIAARRFNNAGMALDLSDLSVNTIATLDQTSPAIAVATDGRFVVTWVSDGQDGDGLGIFTRRFNADGTFASGTTEFRGNNTTTGNQSNPAIAFDSTGGFVIAFEGAAGSDPDGIYIQRFNWNAGQPFGQTRVNTTITGIQSSPSIAVDASDNSFVVGWAGNGAGDADGVFYQRYTSANVKIDGETIISQDTSLVQSNPAIAAAKGGFVAVWSTNASGTNDVFSRRFYDATQVFEVRVSGTTTPLVQNSRIVNPIPAGNSITITFDKPVDEASAETIANYTLMVNGNPNIITDAVLVGNTVTLTITDPINDPSGPINLTISAAVLDDELRPINGDADAVEGGNFSLNFQVNAVSPVNVTTSNTQVAPRPGSVAMTADGRYVVVWQGEGVGDSNGIFARIFGPDGTSLTGEILVNTTTTGPQQNPVVGVDAGGNFVVSWDGQGTGDTTGVFFQRFDLNGNKLGSEVRVNSTTTNTQANPAIAVEADGTFIIAWDGQGTGDNQGGTTQGGVFYRRFSSAGASLLGETRANTFITGTQSTPTVGVDVDGNFVIAWQSNGQDGSGNGIFARRFLTSGTATGAEFQINQFTTNDQVRPTIGFNNAGEFVIAWQSFGQDGSNAGIYARRYTATGGTLGNEFRVNTSVTGDQLSPSIAVAPDGSFVVAWSGIGTGDSDGVFLQQFTALGAKVGTEIVVPPYTTGTQTQPSVAIDATGNYVVVWSGEGALDPSGVFDRVFRATTRVAEVSTSGVSSPLTPGDTVVVPVPASGGLTITFDRDVDAVSAQNPANYLITVDAGLGPMPVNVTSAVLTGRTVSLSLDQFIGDGIVVLTVKDAILGADGRPLDGNADATPGGDFIFTFTVDVQPPAGFAVADMPVAITTLPDGRYIVVRAGAGTGDSAGIFAQVFAANGTTLTSEFRLNQTTVGIQSNPSIAVDPDGGIVAVWQSQAQDGSSWGIYGRRFSLAGTALGAEFRVNQFTTSAQQYPSVAIDADGDFVVAWQSNGQSGVGQEAVYARRFDALANPLSGEFLVAVSPTGVDLLPQVSAGAIGQFVIVWQGADTDGYGIFAQLFTPAGVAVGEPIPVNNFSTGDQLSPTVAMNANGEFVVGWASDGEVPGSIRVNARQFFASGQPVTGDISVSDTPTGTRTQPTVGIDGRGNFVVGWRSESEDGDLGGIYARRFQTGGIADGPAFLVNTVTAGDQQFPAIAVDSDGDFAIAWQTPGLPGDPATTVNRRYDDPLRDDPVGPIVAGVFPAGQGTTGDSMIVPGARLVTVPGGLTVTFSEDVQFANVSANYSLLRDGIVVQSSIPAIYSFDSLTGKYTVRLSANFTLSGVYTLRISGAIVSAATGLPLDGSRDGFLFGDEFVLNFTVVAAEEVVNETASGDQNTTPGGRSVAVAADGRYVVTWSGTGPGDNVGVFARVFARDGTPLTSEFRVNQYTLGEQTVPVVAMDADGDFVIAWQSNGQDGDQEGVFARRYNAAGNPLGNEFQVASTGTGRQLSPTVAIDADGDFIIAWADNRSAMTYEVLAQRYDAAGNPIGSEFKANFYDTGLSATTTIVTIAPAVATDVDGDFIIAWVANDGSGTGTFVRQFDAAGNPIGEGFRANLSTANNHSNPSVAIAGDGTFVVAYTDSNDSSGSGVFALRYSAAGERLSGAIRVNPVTTGTQQAITVAADRDGNFIFAWEGSGTGDPNGVFYRRMDVNGNLVGGEVRANFLAGATQSAPTVAVDANGDFIIAWTDSALDQAGTGVFARSFYDATRLDVVGPIVAGVYPGTITTPDNAISEGVRLDTTPTTLSITFSEDVSGGATPANYSVTRNGAPVEITNVVYGFDPLTRKYTATLTLTTAAGQEGVFEVRVSGAITGAASGTRLDGDINGSGFGEDFVRTFQVATLQFAEDQVNVTTANDQTATAGRSVAVAADGSYIVVWTAADADMTGVFARVYDKSGTPLTGEIQVNQRTTGEQKAPAVAADMVGNFTVVWQTDALGTGEQATEIFGRQFDLRGVALGNEFRVNSTTTNTQTNPSVGADALGNFVVTWEGNGTGDSSGVFFQRYNSAGSTLGGETRAHTFLTGTQSQAAIAVAANGEFVVAWSGEGSGDLDGVFFRKFNSGGGEIVAQTRANSFTTGIQSTPSVAISALGEFVIAWQDDTQDGDGWGVFAKVFNPTGTAFTPDEFQLNLPLGNQTAPAVAYSPDGLIQIVFESDAGGDKNLIGGTFGASGPLFPMTFLVHQFTAGDQSQPSIAVSSTGTLVRVWTSDGQDGSGQGVFAFSTGMTVTQVTEVRFAGSNPIQPNERLVNGATGSNTIFIGFNRNLDPIAAANPTNYEVLLDGVTLVTISSVTLLDHGVRLNLATAINPATVANVQVTVLGSLLDITGVNAIDGDYDGVPGGDFVLPFTVMPPVPIGAIDNKANQLFGGSQITNPGRSVAVADDGRFVAVWTSNSAADPDGGIFARVFAPDGTPLSNEFLVNQFTTGVQSAPVVGLDAAGGFVIAWQSIGQDGDDAGIYARRYSAAGVPISSEIQVNQFTNNNQFAPSLAVDPNGDFVVAWTSDGQDGNLDTAVIARRFDRLARPLDDEFRVNSYTTGNQFGTAVAIDATGDFVIAWEGTGTEDSAGIYFQRYDAAGNRVGGETPVNTTTTNSQSAASVDMDAAGNFVIAWQGEGIGDTSGVFFQRFDLNGNKLGVETRANNTTTNAQSAPSVSIDADGDFVIVWQGQGPGDAISTAGQLGGIFAQRFDAVGAKIGGETKINAFVTGAQINPTVGVDADGDYIVVWTDPTQDGSGNGVFYRVFSAQTPPVASPIPPVVVLEDAANTVIDLSMFFTDKQTTSDLLVYSIVGNTNPTLFADASVTGTILTLDYAADASGFATITVRATDPSGLFTDTVVDVTVTPVNDAPVIIAPLTAITDEDMDVAISGISVSDVDLGAGRISVTLTVTNGTITVTPSGNVQFTTGDGTEDSTMTLFGTLTEVNDTLASVLFSPNDDFNGIANLTVSANDNGNTGTGGPQSATPQVVAITVDPVNDAPMNVVPPSGEVTTINTPLTINTISVTDVDAGSGIIQVTLTVTNGTLTLDGTTGLDFAFTPDVNGSPAGDGTDDILMTFRGTLTDINNALIGMTFTPDLDFPIPLTFGTATIQIDTNDLGNTGSGGPLTDSDSVNIEVVNENRPPVNTLPGTFNGTEDEDLVLTGISVFDPDAAGADITVTFTVTSGSLFLSESVTGGLTAAQITNNGTATVTITAPQSVINITLADANGLTFTPTTDFNGPVTLTMTTDDLGNTGPAPLDPKSDTDMATITIAAVNDPPEFVLNQTDVPVLEDAGAQTVNGFASGFVPGPATATDETGQTLSIATTVVNTTGNLAFAVAPQVDLMTGQLTFTTAPDTNGEATVEVTLTDDNGTPGDTSDDESTTLSFTITVTAVNDRPTFQIPLGNPPASEEDDGEQSVTGFAQNFLPGPATATDEINLPQTLVGYTVTPVSTTGSLVITSIAVDSNGNLTYTAAPDTFGTATFEITVTDSGSGTAPDLNTSLPLTFTITVNDVNDAPTTTPVSLPGATEGDGPITIPFATLLANATPGPNETGGLTITAVGPAVGGTVQIVGSNVVFTLTPGFNGTASFQYTITESSGATPLSITGTASFTVVGVNDAPSFTAGPSLNRPFNSGPQSVIGWATNISAGPPDEAGQALAFTTGIVGTTGNIAFDALPTIDPATGNLQFTVRPGTFGSATFSVVLRDNGGTANGGDDTSGVQTFTITIGDPPPPPPPPPPPRNQFSVSRFATGTDAGPPGTATLFDAAGNPVVVTSPFPGSTAGVRVAVADVNLDGVPDLIATTGPGSPVQVAIIDGVSGRAQRVLTPFEASFTGGAFVAAADIDGDGVVDIAVAPDVTGGPRVVIFSGKTGEPLVSFFGIDDPNFRGGARVAFGDVNGDGIPDLIVGAGFGGGPRVAIWDGLSIRSGTPTRLVNDFFIFEETLLNGAYVTAGDLNGDGKAEIIAGGGPNGGPRVFAVDAATLLATNGAVLNPVADFFAGDIENRQGARVAVKELDGDGIADLIVGAANGGVPAVFGYFGKNLAPGIQPTPAFGPDISPALLGGVFVG